MEGIHAISNMRLHRPVKIYLPPLPRLSFLYFPRGLQSQPRFPQRGVRQYRRLRSSVLNSFLLHVAHCLFAGALAPAWDVSEGTAGTSCWGSGVPEGDRDSGVHCPVVGCPQSPQGCLCIHSPSGCPTGSSPIHKCPLLACKDLPWACPPPSTSVCLKQVSACASPARPGLGAQGVQPHRGLGWAHQFPAAPLRALGSPCHSQIPVTHYEGEQGKISPGKERDQAARERQ